MADVLQIVSFIVVLVVLPVAILVARDTRLMRRQEEQKPLADRIADIHRGAACMADELQEFLDRQSNPPADRVAWIAPVIAYYRRLATLAADPSASVKEIQHLAEQSSTYLREQRLKGVFVAQKAEELAALVRRRDAA